MYRKKEFFWNLITIRVKYLLFILVFACIIGTLFSSNIYAKENNKDKLVKINDLQNYTSLKKDCSDEEFRKAYDAARGIVEPLVGKSRINQVRSIYEEIRKMVDSGQVNYSMEAPHYNDPYGYFVLGVGSCAGATRATGLCLNMLGIPYEHIHENQYCHQWARVSVGGEYWIVDAYGLVLGEEPEPYKHPTKE